MSSALEFGRLGFRNFLSYPAKEIVIDLSGDFITCILGENRDTGGEDSRNGVGKSAIIDALCFVLFGTVIRGISNQKLINKMSNKGQMVTWVEFKKDEYAYRIERTERPGKLLFLRKPVDSEEDFKTKEGRKLKFDKSEGKTETTAKIIEILGFNITLFEYLVANSSESTEFFRLTEDQQRKVVEPLFGFTIMSTKAAALKDDRKDQNKELVQAESAAEATKQANSRIQSQITDLESRSKVWEQKKVATINELSEASALLETVDVENEIAIIKEMNELQGALKDVKTRIKQLETEQSARNSTKKQHERDAERAVRDMEKAQTTIDALDKSECPTCKQHWEPDPEVRTEAHNMLGNAQQAGTDSLAAFEAIEKEIFDSQGAIDGEHGNESVIDEGIAEYASVEMTYQTVEEAASAETELEGIKTALSKPFS